MLNKKVALVCVDNVGKVMAGPGIRYFEMAKVLSKHFDVTLLAPNECDLKSDSFKIKTYDSKSASKSIARQLSGIDVVIAQTLRPPLLNFLRKNKIRFITDLYDPLTVETLEQIKYDSKKIQKNTFNFIHFMQAIQMECADHILCASEKQRDLYTGMLFGTKSISPELYKDNPDFTHIFSVVPFGLSNKEPQFSDQEMIYIKFPTLKPTDKVIFWGGGIWNWFDPLSVIKAIEKISKTRNDIKMVFLGVKHPNPKIKQMAVAKKTLDYCTEHDLINKLVFFNHDWTPYNDRVNYLLQASIGISTHFDNLETRFSFRTRILDYLWANLPMIVTEGDSMADFVREKNLGKVVRYENIDDISQGIIDVLDKKDFYAKNVKEAKNIFYWDNTLKDLISVIKEEKYFNRKRSMINFIHLSWNYYLTSHRYGR